MTVKDKSMQDLHFDALMDKCGDSKTGIILTRRQRAWLILGLWCIAVDRWHVDRWHCIITQERERERALSSSLHVVFCWNLSLYLCVRQNQLSADNWSGSGSKCDFDFPPKNAAGGQPLKSNTSRQTGARWKSSAREKTTGILVFISTQF